MSGFSSQGSSAPSASAAGDRVFDLLQLLGNQEMFAARLKELQDAEKAAADAHAAAQSLREQATKTDIETRARLEEVVKREQAVAKQGAELTVARDLTDSLHAGRQKQLDQQNADLAAATASFHERYIDKSNELAEREKQVSSREALANSRHAAISAREQIVDAQMNKIKEIAQLAPK